MKNSDMPTELLTPILKCGIHNTNFFNGRLLSAEDMQREQQANRQQHQQLGQALGEGVAYGLEVSRKDIGSEQGNPSGVVSVKKGMAINRIGQALYLPQDIDLTLICENEAVAEATGLFASCEKLNTTEPLSGTGIYLLVISPASGYEGMAPASCLVGDLNARGGCRRRDTVEGVQFRLVEVGLTSQNTSQQTFSLVNELRRKIVAGQDKQMNLSKLRNVLAHLCFGTEDQAGIVADPLSAVNGTANPDGYGLIDKLRNMESPNLTECDVSLGLIYWTRDGVQFVDLWSVRRKVVPATSSPKPLPFTHRRLTEAEAALLQFQGQIAEIVNLSISHSDRNKIDARDWFRYLPPAGMIPIATPAVSAYMIKAGASTFKTSVVSRGVDPAVFFAGMSHRDLLFIESAHLGSIINTSFSYPPIDLDSKDKEMIWLYLVRNNIEPGAEGGLSSFYLLFTNGHISYQGNARFNLARWDYGNYAFI